MNEPGGRRNTASRTPASPRRAASRTPPRVSRRSRPARSASSLTPAPGSDARPRSPFVDTAFRAVDHDVRTGGGVLAGAVAVAFRMFLFLVPYVFLVVVGFGVAAEAADRDPGELARDADRRPRGEGGHGGR